MGCNHKLLGDNRTSNDDQIKERKKQDNGKVYHVTSIFK